MFRDLWQWLFGTRAKWVVVHEGDEQRSYVRIWLRDLDEPGWERVEEQVRSLEEMGWRVLIRPRRPVDGGAPRRPFPED